MPTRKGLPALQPLAKTIQAAMKEKGLDMWMLTEAMGMSVKQRGAVGNWIIGKNGVSDPYRPKLAAILGLDEAHLKTPELPGVRKSGHNDSRPKLVPPTGPAQRAVALVQQQQINGGAAPQLLPTLPPVSDVFTIRARSDGTMIVKLDANLNYERGSQLVQFLLGFGLVMGAERDGG